MPREDVIVKAGHEFDHFFPKAKLITITKKKGARVEDTLRLIPWVIRETAFHTKRFAHEYIKAETVKKGCERLWHFVYQHIAYKKDEDGKEQVRSPARTWHDRHNKGPDGEQMGVDCDCMTVFVVSVLYNLGIKKIFFRITKYEQEHFEHIYPIVVLPDGEQITIDCVTRQFNYETPYKEKKDTAMDLEYLNGVNDSAMERFTDTADFLGIMEEQEAFAELGRILRRNTGGAPAPAKKPILTIRKPQINLPKPQINLPKPNLKITLPVIKKSPEQKQKTVEKKQQVKNFIGKSLHLTNRINPVTVALRNGVLAGMKLNFMQIGSNLRWAYLNEEEAVRQGADRGRFRKLREVREKLEKIFHGAGGLTENLKKAILTGKGNTDKAVPLNGLGNLSSVAAWNLNEDMPLNQLLGQEIYYSENVQGMEGFAGFSGLGEVTAASVAAASTALTAIAGLIKSIGSVFPNKRKAPESGSQEQEQRPASEQGNSEPSSSGSGSQTPSGSGEGGGSSAPAASRPAPSGGDATGNESGTNEAGNSGSETDKEQTPEPRTGSSTNAAGKTTISLKAKAFWEKNKKVLKPVGFVAGTLGLLYLAYRLLKPKKKSDKPLSGIQKRKVSKKAAPFYSTKPAGKISKGKTQKKKSIHLL